MRRFTEPKLVVASHNEGKVSEIRALLEPYGIETVSAAELNLPVLSSNLVLAWHLAHLGNVRANGPGRLIASI